MFYTVLKYLVLVLVGCSFSLPCLSQNDEKGDGILNTLYCTQMFNGQNRFEQGYGLNFQYFIADRVALEYNLTYVTVPNNVNYLKVYGGGLLTGYATTYLFQQLAGDAYVALLLVSALVPDGISIHIPVGDNLTLSPYIHVTSFDISDRYLHYNNVLGLRMNMKVLNRLNIAPFAFGQVQYRSRTWGGTRFGLGMGAMLGWRF